MGRVLLELVVLLCVLSSLLRIAPRVPMLSWLGRLPGDLRIPMGRGWLLIPIGSAVVVSLLIRLVLRFGILLVR